MLGGPFILATTTVAAAARTAQAMRAGYPVPQLSLSWPRRARTAGGCGRGCTAGVRQRPSWRWRCPASWITTPASGRRAVQIAAPAHVVWPWIAQIGQDRGGFYSYTWLENLAGCRMHNADRIHPEWQQRAAGETVLLHPASGLKVMRFEPGSALVLEVKRRAEDMS